MEPWFRTMLGCDRATLRQHLEGQFEDKMTWENYGVGREKWNIEHIRHMASYRLGEFAQDCAAMSFTNLRPMWRPPDA
jgi:uncharacterized protein (DUF2249 family)